MSYVEVFAVRPDGEVTKYGEAQNAFGGAMHIWVTLNEQYHVGCSILDFRPLWKQIKELSEPDRWVLGSTFDWFLIEREHLPTLIKHLTTFVEQYPSETLIEEIAILDCAVQDENVVAIGFNQTSVNDMWYGYNLNTGTKHKYLTPAYIERIYHV